jgi:hypothetical protein
LRSGRIAEADLENIAEEIESLGHSQGRELESRITQIIEHLLKLDFTRGIMRDQNERLWRVSIAHQGAELRTLLKTSPPPPAHSRVVGGALLDAASVFATAFEIQPPECPFT